MFFQISIASTQTLFIQQTLLSHPHKVKSKTVNICLPLRTIQTHMIWLNIQQWLSSNHMCVGAQSETIPHTQTQPSLFRWQNPFSSSTSILIIWNREHQETGDKRCEQCCYMKSISHKKLSSF